jgi:hypothetical protein
LSAALAGLGWLAACCGATAQLSVDTIGGGVRKECGPAYGFTNGNTYDTAQFNAPYACALDANGNLWIADKNNNALEQVTQAGDKSTSVTIPCILVDARYTTNGHTITTNYSTNYHSFTNITGVAVDPANNLYVLLPSPPQVLKLNLTTLSSSFGLNSSVLSTLVFTNTPTNLEASAMAVDGSSNVFLAFTNGVIIRFPLLDNTHSSQSTNYSASYSEVTNIVTNFTWQPSGLALLADGNLAVSDILSNAIYVVATNNSATNSPQLLSGGNGAGYTEGLPDVAQFNQPIGLAASADGSLIVCDMLNNRVRAIDTTSNTTSPSMTLYGTYSTIWPATCCTCDPTLYAGWVDGVAGITSTNATGRLPVSVAISPTGTLFVTELYYSLIRQVTNTSYSPVNLSATFPVAVTEAATGVTSTNATFNGTVTATNATASYYFEWGLTTNFGNFTATNMLTTNLNTAQPVFATIGNLTPGATYFFQLVAFNGLGYSLGGTNSLLALAESAVVTTLPATDFTTTTATLNASVNPNFSLTQVYFQWGTTATNLTNTTAPISLTTNLTATQPVSTTIINLQRGTIYFFQAVAANSGGLVEGSVLDFITLSVAPAATNFVGFPQPLFGGPGGHLYVPVFVNLQSNATLQSVQFRVEIAPIPPNTNMIAPIELQPLTPNDLVPLPGPAPADAPVTFVTYSYTNTISSNGQGLVITASGAGSGLDMQGSGVVVMLHLAIPTTAAFGQSYSLAVLDPSGTSDGQQASVVLDAMTNQILTIAYTPYMVGDSSPSTGYNAGQFGNKDTTNSVEEFALDNADVNNAIYASVGIRVPPSDSDIYNAMDAWPPDSTSRGGDGFIRLLDWETILGRSLGVVIYPGMDLSNYLRFWAPGDIGFPSHTNFDWVAGDAPLPLSLVSAPGFAGSSPTKLDLSNSPPGLVWFCQAAVGSGTIIDALPGNTYSLPVYVNVLPGYNLAALQFRAIITGSSGAPPVTSIKFNPAAGVPNSLALSGLTPYDIVNVWGFGSFAVPLQNSNYLGTISFQVPSGVNPGASYALHFSGVDGAPDSSTEYEFESHPGSVWVMSAAQQPASITSDEWKIAFFGSLTNSQAGDNVDADGDGELNWQEYVAGTNPTNALSCLRFSSASLYSNGLRGAAINWLTAPGKTYFLQSSAALEGANWTAINTNTGDGNEYQIIVTNISGNARFYQLLLQP